jgi:hypothetical protein
VEHGVETRLAKQLRKCRSVENIKLNEAECWRRLMRNIAPSAQPQIIDAPNLFSPLDQTIAKMTANEASTTGYENSHGLSLIADLPHMLCQDM